MENRVLSGYEPALVWKYFEDISAIPRVSGDEKAVSEYVAAFGRAHGLEVYTDEVHNVFIKHPASKGHEGAETVMFQGHMDMVGEKEPDSSHDFAKDGLTLLVDESGWLHADGTTLGGDDGIAVATMLALLDNPPEPHPAFECLFTVSEETGLYGAWGFDPQAAGAKSTRMINMDSEAEGILTAGCAGGVRTDITIPAVMVPAEGASVRVELQHFSGGHSGVEIQEGHTNAIKALGRILYALKLHGHDFGLNEIGGGGKDNAIPRDAHAVVTVPAADAQAFADAFRAEAEGLRAEPQLIAADLDFTCTAEVLADKAAFVMDPSTTDRVMTVLTLVRDGMMAMNAHVEGLVAYSRNLGILTTHKDEAGAPVSVSFSFSTRSATNRHLDAAQDELACLASLVGSTAKHSARYPGWEYATESALRDIWTEESEKMFGVTPRVEVIHAGLECGILCDKMPGMDIISIGPDMRDIHTTREHLSIESSKRTYDLVCAVLTRLA